MKKLICMFVAGVLLFIGTVQVQASDDTPWMLPVDDFYAITEVYMAAEVFPELEYDTLTVSWDTYEDWEHFASAAVNNPVVVFDAYGKVISKELWKTTRVEGGQYILVGWLYHPVQYLDMIRSATLYKTEWVGSMDSNVHPTPTPQTTPEPTPTPFSTPGPTSTMTAVPATVPPIETPAPAEQPTEVPTEAPSATAAPVPVPPSPTPVPTLSVVGNEAIAITGDGENKAVNTGSMQLPISPKDLQNQFKTSGGTQVVITDPYGFPLKENAVVGTGHLVSIQNEHGTPIDTATVIVPGDVMGTGKINIAQLVRVARAVTGQSPLTGPYLKAITDGNRVTIADLVREANLLK